MAPLLPRLAPLLACRAARAAAGAAEEAADFRAFEASVWPRYRDRFRAGPGPGEYAHVAGGAPAMIGSANMLLAAYILGQPDLAPADAAAWADRLSAWQDPATGYFTAANFSNRNHDTAQAVSALRVVGRRPRFPMRYASDLAADPSRWADWIGDPTSYDPRGGYEGLYWAMSTAADVAVLGMTDALPAPFRRFFADFLANRTDAATGFYNWWMDAAGRADRLSTMKLYTHPAWVLDLLLDEPRPRARAVVDNTLALQNPATGMFDRVGDGSTNTGLWDVNPTCCHFDGLYVAARTSRRAGGYRWGDVRGGCRAFLRRSAELLNNATHVDATYGGLPNNVLLGGLYAVAECAKWFPDLIRTARPWRSAIDAAPYL